MTKIITTKTIDIEYTEETEKEALQLKELIDNNHQIFHDFFLGLDKISFTNFKDETTLSITSITDLKEQLRERIPAFMADTIPQIEAANNGQAEVMYLKFLLLDKYKTIGQYAPEFASNSEYQMYVNSIFSLAAAVYYMNQNTPEKMVDFIFEFPPTEKEKILTWLNEKHRYELLNLLLDDQYQLIIQAEDEETARDPFMKKYLDSILAAIQTDFISSPIYLYDDINTEMPSLTKDELDQLCVEFFTKIDSSGTWLKKYNDIKTERIVCSKAEDSSIIDWYCVPYGDSFAIIAPLTGTIRDFRSLVHEFAHYITLEPLGNNEIITPSIYEYPSLVLEQEAIKFLEEKGYLKEAVDTLRIERQVWTEENILDVNPVLRYLVKYLNNGPITYEKEQEESLAIISDYESYGNQELMDIISKYIKADYESLTQKIDMQNTFLLQYPDYVVKAYPYVISMYLAKRTEERITDDPTTINRVVETINNIKYETPESIISKLGLQVENINITPPTNPKEYIKKSSPEKQQN